MKNYFVKCGIMHLTCYSYLFVIDKRCIFLRCSKNKSLLGCIQDIENRARHMPTYIRQDLKFSSN